MISAFSGRANTRWMMVLLLFIMGACTSLQQPSLRVDHYTLEYAPPPPVGRQALSVILRVERFSVAASYNTQQMVYREGSFKRETYAYHRWRANPGDLVSDNLARDMRQSGLFQAVVQEGSTVAATHIVEGSVDEFFEWSSGEGWKAALTVTATLIKAKEIDTSKKILFQQRFHVLQPCREKSPTGFAEAMSEAMSRVSGQIMKTMHEHLSSAIGH